MGGRGVGERRGGSGGLAWDSLGGFGVFLREGLARFAERFANMFEKFAWGDVEVEGAVFHEGNFASFFADDDDGGIGFFGESDCGSMSEAEGVGEVWTIGDREEGGGGDKGFAAEDDASIVEGRVFGEDGDEEFARELGIEADAGIDEFFERVAAFDGDEAAEFFTSQVGGGGGDFLLGR